MGLQKMGDIEGILEAVFVKFGYITDQFVKKDKKWKEQNKKYKEIKNKWSQFVEKYFISDSNVDKKDVQNMFAVLTEKFDEMQQEKERLTESVSIYKEKDKKQQTETDELEEKMLKLRMINDELRNDNNELEQFKEQYLNLEQKLTETQQQFEHAKNTYSEKMEKDKKEFDELKQRHLMISNDLNKRTEELKVIGLYARELETKQKELNREINDIRLENEELNGSKELYLTIGGQLKQKENELETLKSENMILTERSSDFDDLKVKHMETTQELDEVTAKFEGLEDEFAVIYKAKKKLKSENNRLLKELNVIKDKMVEYEQIVNVEKVDNCTQTDFVYIAENEYLAALQSDNLCLMKELNF